MEGVGDVSAILIYVLEEKYMDLSLQLAFLGHFSQSCQHISTHAPNL